MAPATADIFASRASEPAKVTLRRWRTLSSSVPSMSSTRRPRSVPKLVPRSAKNSPSRWKSAAKAKPPTPAPKPKPPRKTPPAREAPPKGAPLVSTDQRPDQKQSPLQDRYTGHEVAVTRAAGPSGGTWPLSAMHHHAVLARPLGRVQSLIGQLHQLKPILERFIHRGHPYADRQRFILPILCRHSLHHTPGQPHRAIFAALRQQHHKLFAAVPSRKVRQSHRRSQNRPQATQHLITRRMSPPIVDRLEVVHIDQQYRKLPLPSARHRKLHHQPLLKRPAIPQTSQLIGHRKLPQLIIGLFELTMIAFQLNLVCHLFGHIHCHARQQYISSRVMTRKLERMQRTDESIRVPDVLLSLNHPPARNH